MEFDSQALSAMEDPYPVFDAIDPAAETDLFEGLTDPLPVAVITEPVTTGGRARC